jgi:NAD(P)-dependent dehydrogenase (short-subunit alcohol dehydrogenase family)
MHTSLVTGSNRGIGLELTKQLRARGHDVIAVCRTPSKELTATGARVESGIDVADPAALTALTKKLGDVKLDLAIHNAGILDADRLDALDADSLVRSFQVNAMGPLLLTLGSALFVVVSGRVVQLQRALFTVTLSIAALTWLVGNLLWLYQWPFNRIVPWWMAFLGLTVIGERLELSRFQKPVPAARPLFLVALSLFLAGVLLSAFLEKAGAQLAGLGLLALAGWLARFDLARRTIKQPGLPRFMAVCLLSGYVWLAFAGLLLIRLAPLESGLRYDPVLHAFFLGFIFAMIFGHAPVIFPAVLQRPVAFSRRFYSHVLLLHLSLLLRVVGDLTGWAAGRHWGGILNALALRNRATDDRCNATSENLA